MKLKITFNPHADNPAHTYIVDETNFMRNNFGSGAVLMGLDGKLYENYGGNDAPMWEEVFDNDYFIEITEV